MNGHWQFPEEIDIEQWFGFIYRIRENFTGREYIGKKQFKSYNKRKIKGRTNRKTVTKESDWKTYKSSSKELQQRIEENGIDNYSFFIESLHETRGSLFYAEVEKQIKENVLREKLDDNVTPKYFNKNISGVKFIPPEETTKESYTNVNNYIYKINNVEFGGAIGEKNGMYGKTHPRKGLTFEEYYGKERATAIKQKLREASLNNQSGQTKGFKWLEEQKENIKGDPRRSHKGEKNGMYGKPCYYKMSEEEKEQWKTNVGNSVRGLKRSKETKKKMSESRKGMKYKTVTCPHCKRTGGAGNMKRYHYEFCKKNPNRQELPENLKVKKKLCVHCDQYIDPGNYARLHGDKCKKKI